MRSCGWRASLNGRAQRGESGRRFWARRFSPVERVFTAECVGVDGSLVPRANRVDGERFSVTSRIYKRAQPKILSTVTRVSRCVKNSAERYIGRVVFRIVASSSRARLSAHPLQFSRFSLCLTLFTYLLIRYSVFAPGYASRREKLAVEFRRPTCRTGRFFSGSRNGTKWSSIVTGTSRAVAS